MEYHEINHTEIPLELLLIADPSISNIQRYLPDSLSFIASKKRIIIGACIVKPSTPHKSEIFNISVLPEYQCNGVGSGLLKYVLFKLSEKGVNDVELGTGCFGYQLTFYHRIGFRVKSIIKNHFLDNYSEPIFENGVQHKDMLRLELKLKQGVE